MTLKTQLDEATRAALKAGDKPRLSVLRMAMAAIKQREVDTRQPLDDANVQAVLEKMIKQGRDAQQQYEQAGRGELAAKEAAEIEILRSFLPEPLSEAELDALIADVIEATGAAGMRDMGKVMAGLKARAAGRVDMSAAGQRVRALLNSG